MGVALSGAWLGFACVRALWPRADHTDLTPGGGEAQARLERFEAITVAVALALGLAALIAALISAAGHYASPWIELSLVSAGGLVWLCGAAPPSPRPSTTAAPRPQRGQAWALTIAVAIGVLLRLTPSASPLGGQDQGSYTLRAQQSLRSGAIEFHDELLETVQAAALTGDPAANDLLGLYPIDDALARADIYEGAYRPGFYLRDRETGAITPQFFALHPAGMQLAGSVAGAPRVHLWMPLCACVFFVAFGLALRRRVGAGWAAFASLGLALCPVAIWTQRLTLSEGSFMMLLAAAWLAAARSQAPHKSGGTPDAAGRLIDLGRDIDHTALRWQRVSFVLLALATWCRGEGWIFGPLLAAALLWRPKQLRARFDGARLFVLIFAAGVVFHAQVAFPYVHDELLRRFDTFAGLRPVHLQFAAVAGALCWLGIDVLGTRRAKGSPPSPTIASAAKPTSSRILAALAALALGIQLAAWLDSPTAHGRLDPLGTVLGWPALALVALVLAHQCWRPRRLPWADRPFALLAVASLALYLPRAMPSSHLFYYGRYLVPILLPAAFVALALSLAALHPLRPWLARVAASAALIGCAWPLVYGTAWPEGERAGSREALAWLAEQTPDDAIIIAGGEGWHRGFTDHQVATALMFGHDRRVLPYRNREAAITSTYALLGADDSESPSEAEGLAQGRPVYWLVNEASHHYTREQDGRVYAGADLLLPADLRATGVTHFELWSHRHTPSQAGIPSRRTRDGMRMSLVRVRRSDTQAHELALPEASRCLPAKGWLKIPLPSIANADAPGEILITLNGHDAIDNLGVRVRVGMQTRDFNAGDEIRRPRATLGPFAVAAGTRSLSVRGFPGTADTGRRCEHGELLSARWLAAPHAAALDAPGRSHSFEPLANHGQPYLRSHFVPGRAFSRFRPGRSEPGSTSTSTSTSKSLPLKDLSVRVRADASASFDPMFLPAGAGAHDVVLTLTRSQLAPGARLQLWLGQVQVQEIDPPDARTGSWQAPKLRWTSSAPLVGAQLRLVGAGPEDFVDVRDVALFSVTGGPEPEIHSLE